MSNDVLEQSEAERLLHRFTTHFGIAAARPKRAVLADVIRAFAQLPYENLSKIIKTSRAGAGVSLRRGPTEVICEHQQWGTGGTCFSLTFTLLQLLRTLGWRAEPILADRRYGANTHCALLIWLDESPHLIDPGYLIVDPVPLPRSKCQRVVTEFNEIVLVPREEGKLVNLSTWQQGRETYRLTYKTAPVDAGEFVRAWDASFGWDMMRYPLLTRAVDRRQIYLRGTRLQVRDQQHVQRTNVIIEQLPVVVATDFGIQPGIVRQALEVLRQRGEL